MLSLGHRITDDYHFLHCIFLQSGYIFYDQEIKSHHVKDCCKFSFWQQTLNLLPFSSRSLRSMGSLKRIFTKFTRNASEGKCPAQLSLLTPSPRPCTFPSKALAQGTPSRSTLPGRGPRLRAELCVYVALWRGGGEVELGWRTLAIRPRLPAETRHWSLLGRREVGDSGEGRAGPCVGSKPGI